MEYSVLMSMNGKYNPIRHLRIQNHEMGPWEGEVSFWSVIGMPWEHMWQKVLHFIVVGDWTDFVYSREELNEMSHLIDPSKIQITRSSW